MVKPSLPAVFGSPKNFLPRLVKHLLRDCVPLSRLEFEGALGEEVVLLGSPGDPGFVLEEIEVLEVEKLGFFVEEDGGEDLPGAWGLSGESFTSCCYFCYRKWV